MASFTFELGVLGGIEAGNGEPAERRARDSGALGDIPPRPLAYTAHGLVFVHRPCRYPHLTLPCLLDVCLTVARTVAFIRQSCSAVKVMKTKT